MSDLSWRDMGPLHGEMQMAAGINVSYKIPTHRQMVLWSYVVIGMSKSSSKTIVLERVRAHEVGRVSSRYFGSICLRGCGAELFDWNRGTLLEVNLIFRADGLINVTVT